MTSVIVGFLIVLAGSLIARAAIAISKLIRRVE